MVMPQLTPQQIAEYNQARLQVTINHANSEVSLRGPEAATMALYVLEAFTMQFGAARSQLPPDVQRLLDASDAAFKAAAEVMNRRVVVASGIPSATPGGPLIR